MKKMKKLLAGALALSTMLACAGCNTSKVEYKDDESQEYTVNWFYVVSKKPKDLQKIEDKISEYTMEKINAKVHLVPLEWGEYSKKTNNALSAQEKMDLFYTSGGTYAKYAYEGSIIDVTDLLDEYAPKTKELLGQDFVDGSKINGKLYGVPANKDKGLYNMVVYRKDLADKYGIGVPEKVSSWRELYPVFDAIKEKEPDMYAFSIGSGRSPWSTNANVEFFGQNVSSAVVGFVGDSETAVNLYETEEYKESAKIAREMYERGYIPKDVAVQEKTTELTQQGRAFSTMQAGHPSKIAEMNATEKEFVWAGVAINEPHADTGTATGSMMAIPYSCENPVRVMKFVELFNTDDYLRNLVNFGIEGVHYNKVSDTQIEMIEGSGYGDPSMQWVYGNNFGNYTLSSEDPKKHENMEAFNATLKYSKFNGFNPDLSTLLAETTACTNALNKYRSVMEFGVEPAEKYLDTLNAELKASGIDRIIEEVQRQYDEWKKVK